VAIGAVSVAATLILTTPRQPDHFTIRPVPVEQTPAPAPPPAAASPAPIAAPPKPATVPPAAAPPPAAVSLPLPSAQRTFNRSLRGDTPETQNGAGLYPTESPAAIDSEAESMCNDLANGGSLQPYITGTLQKSPTLAPWQAAQVIHQAIQAYCPQDDR